MLLPLFSITSVPTNPPFDPLAPVGNNNPSVPDVPSHKATKSLCVPTNFHIFPRTSIGNP